MIENHFEQRTIELNEIDLGFCRLSIIVMVNLCGFTQQLGVYRMVKLKTRFKNMSVLGVKCVVAYPTYSFYKNKKLLSYY
jgi:glutathione peroxidase-family protein